MKAVTPLWASPARMIPEPCSLAQNNFYRTAALSLAERSLPGSAAMATWALTKSASLPGESEKAGANGRHRDVPDEPAQPVAPLERGPFPEYWPI
jgi:hypothetical protein